MQTFLISTTTVALAEIGDKTQLLSLILAAKYRKPWPICARHSRRDAGQSRARGLGRRARRAMADARSAEMDRRAELLLGRAVDAEARQGRRREAARGARYGVLMATVIAFFIAEMGDKTQVATVVLAAQYHPLWQVVAGTTIGMLLANVPVVWLGSRFASKLPLKAARIAAALLFAALGFGFWCGRSRESGWGFGMRLAIAMRYIPIPESRLSTHNASPSSSPVRMRTT